jgi:hypothetical protein
MNRYRHWLYILGLVALLLTSALAVTACEPETEITFQNELDHELNIFIATVRYGGGIGKFTDYGMIPANSSKVVRVTFLGDDHVFRIQLRDHSGNVLFNQAYNRTELEDEGWTIVIGPETSD